MISGDTFFLEGVMVIADWFLPSLTNKLGSVRLVWQRERDDWCLSIYVRKKKRP
jgi:hypothetical protein